MFKFLSLATLIGLLGPIPSVATVREEHGCYPTAGGSHLCFVAIGGGVYSVAFNDKKDHPQYPTAFIINCNPGGPWQSYGPLPVKNAPLFVQAFCEGRNADFKI